MGDHGGISELPINSDSRPESSPYIVPSVTVRLSNGTKLYIPDYYLRKCPKLYDQDHSLKLSAGVGHVLVHWLITETYQSVRPKGDNDIERSIAEFKTSVGVYVAAQLYDLPHLLELARNEIEKHGDKLSTPLVYRLLQDEYTIPVQKDLWMDCYLKARMKSFLKHPSNPLDAESGHTRSGDLQIIDVLLKNLYELLSRSKEELPRKESPEAPAFDEGTDMDAVVNPFSQQLGKSEPASNDVQPIDDRAYNEARIQEDDGVSLKAKKKKKKGALTLPAGESTSEPIPEPPNEKESISQNEEHSHLDIWGFPKKDKKKKKGKGIVREPADFEEKGSDPDKVF